MKRTTKLFEGLIILAVVFLVSCSDSASKKDAATSAEQLIVQANDSLSNNREYSKQCLHQALLLTSDSILICKANLVKGAISFVEGRFDSTKYYCSSIIRFSNRQRDSQSIYELKCGAYNLMGNYVGQLGMLDSAIGNYSKALSYNHKLDDKPKRVNILINIGDTYLAKGDYASSSLMFHRALLLSDSAGLTAQFRFPISFGLGQLYKELYDYDVADYYFKMAERDFSSRSMIEKETFANNRGNYYYYKGDYRMSLKWFRVAKPLAVAAKMEFNVHLCDLNLSDVFLNLGMLDSADYYIRRSAPFFESTGNPTAIYYVNTIKGGIELKRGNLKVAQPLLEIGSTASGVSPSIKSIRNGYLEMLYQQQGRYADAYRVLKQAAAMERIQQSEQIKKRIAEHNMRYAEDTTILRRDIKIKNQQIEIRRFKTFRIVGSLLFVILALSVTFYFMYHRKQNDLREMNYANKISQLRLSSIRRRVSPHLIFNVLSRTLESVRDTPQENDLRGVIALLRHGLVSAEQLNISLSDEMDFVRTYINVEASSLGVEFQYSEILDPSLDLARFEVPSMVVQIPVENAIKHGLKGKEGAKSLGITISKQNGGVFITVEDNGRGLEDGSPSYGTGTGLRVIYQTLQILNQKNDRKLTFSIKDRKEDGANGVRVEIFIPSDYKFIV
jgi:Putative regulator of cell autolysis